MPLTKKKQQQNIHVFIDTNVFLRFFLFTGDDIDQLKKLKVEIEAEKLTLHLPAQVVDEFGRNRENKIKEALDGFEKCILKPVPRLLMGYPAASEYETALDLIKKTQNELLEAARKDAAAQKLPADELFAELSATAGLIETSEEIYARALVRRNVGNPPGKDDRLGDRIAWECLLGSVPDDNDLHIVSKDGDYQSPLDSGRPRQFLLDEWAQKKHGTLRLHTEIKPFLNVHFALQFASLKQEKDAAVNALKYAGSFAATHAAVAQLEPYIDLLTKDDIIELAQAAVDNSQIHWIAADTDVHALFSKILPPVLDKLEPTLRKNVEELLALNGKSDEGQ